MNPTYAVMCHLLPYIPPAYWVYFIDEEIPYEVRALPEWRPDAVSAFVRCHKRDWKEIGQRYGISESLANNIFVSHRARPTVSLIRNAKKITIQIWGGGVELTSFKELEVLKYFNGFDPRYVSHHMYLPLLSRRLNNYHYTKFFEDKGVLGKLSDSGIQFPYCLVRCIDGEFYDNYLHQISHEQAEKLCLDYGQNLIFKISRESSGGHSIRKLKLKEMTDTEKPSAVKELLSTPAKDYVVQKCIEQSAVMSQFNESSVNTFRIITLYLNGKVTLCYTLLRIGQKGSDVDNMCSGGIGVGVEADGKIHKYGYNYALDKLDVFNGVVFDGKRIEHLPSIINQILETHKKCFPLCKFIGWDVCINERNEPVIIELNSSQPEIFVGQLNNGPVFGERTQEVIDYIKTKPFIYNKALMGY